MRTRMMVSVYALTFAFAYNVLAQEEGTTSTSDLFNEYWWLVLIIPLTLGMKKLMDKIDTHPK